jgi:hypothetical protein
VVGALVTGAKLKAVRGAVPARASVKYQWLRNGKAIKGAKHKTYRVTAADANKKLAVRIQVKARGKSKITQTSLGRVVSKSAKAVKVRKVAIRGRAAIGATLKARTGKWSPKGTKLSYQWTRDGWNIPGATQRSYKVKARDAGARIGLVVVGKARGRGAGVAQAPAKRIPARTSPVPAPPQPAPPQAAPPQVTPPQPAPPVTAPPSFPPWPAPPYEDPAPLPTDPTAPPTDTPTPKPPKPPAPPAKDPTVQVPPIADPRGLTFTVGDDATKGQMHLTQANLETLVFPVPTWIDAMGKPVPPPDGADSVLLELLGTGTNPIHMTSPEFTAANLKTWGLLTPADAALPTSNPPADASGRDGWRFVPGVALDEDGEYFELIRMLPSDNYTVRMTVTKAAPANGAETASAEGTASAAAYAPMVATWPLEWTNPTSEPIAVESVVDDNWIEFMLPELPEGAMHPAEDFAALVLNIPSWTDAFGRTIGLAPDDSIAYIGMCAASRDPNQILKCELQSDGSWLTPLSGELLEWPIDPNLASSKVENLLGKSMGGGPGKYSLLPLTALLPTGEGETKNLEILNGIGQYGFAFRTKFTRPGFTEFRAEWIVLWNMEDPRRPPS